MDIRERINELFDETVALRRCLHANPELSEQEKETSALVSDFLSKNHISHETGVGGYGIVAVIEGKGNKSQNQRFITVGLRGDMDALPIEENNELPYKSKNRGVMHACGHDIHTAVLMGAAKVLKGMEDILPGNVKFFFEAAEETVGGAKPMIEAGCMENPHVDAVLGIHIEPALPVGMVEFRRGKMNAASTEFEITIRGAASHGAHPETGVDSIVAAASVVSALQSIVTRNLAPTNPGIITIGQIHGGTKDNVVAKETKLTGIIRALDNHTRDYLKERVAAMSEGVAAGFGAKVMCTFRDSYPALINDDEVCALMEKTAEELFTGEKVRFMPEPSLGADDFSYFSQVANAVYFNIGTLTEGEKNQQMLHSEFLNPNEECIRVGMLMEVFGALELMKQMK